MTPSRIVTSAQPVRHPRLGEIVARHLGARFLREPGAAGRRAFATLPDAIAREPFVLDAGCGTGASTLELARRRPDRLVVGVDKSAARLARGARPAACAAAPRNAVLLRCDLVDFWQLAAAAGLRCERQFLLYPNPWPKPHHVMRRWHAHPVLPSMLALGGAIELRTNWRVYAEEFALALGAAGWTARCEPLRVAAPLSPFERKYALSGHALWTVVAASGARRMQREEYFTSRVGNSPPPQ